MPRDGLDMRVPTHLSAKKEYGWLQSGKRVELRNKDGLTHWGKQKYETAELIVEVPALQVGRNAKGETYRIKTTKVFTEAEYPGMGQIWAEAEGGNEKKTER